MADNFIFFWRLFCILIFLNLKKCAKTTKKQFKHKKDTIYLKSWKVFQSILFAIDSEHFLFTCISSFAYSTCSFWDRPLLGHWPRSYEYKDVTSLLLLLSLQGRRSGHWQESREQALLVHPHATDHKFNQLQSLLNIHYAFYSVNFFFFFYCAPTPHVEYHGPIKDRDSPCLQGNHQHSLQIKCRNL